MRILFTFLTGFSFGWLAGGMREAGRRWDEFEAAVRRRNYGEVYDQDRDI